MRDLEKEEKETYHRINNAIKKAMRPGDNKAVVCTVLLKNLMAEILFEVRESGMMLETLSNAINEAVESMKEKGLVK